MHGHNRSTAKAKNSKQAWKKYWASIKKYRLMIFASIIFAIASAIVALFIPKILGDMTNIAVATYPEINFDELGHDAITVIILFMIFYSHLR